VIERAQRRVADGVNRPAAAAVAAIRAAPRHEPLASERYGAVAAVSPQDLELNFVNKHNKPGECIDAVTLSAF
jgi:hypothetical protein